jgi:hypothetical protein
VKTSPLLYKEHEMPDEYTEESALIELSKMFPSPWHCEVSRVNYLGGKSRRVYTRYDIHVTDFEKNDFTESGTTLDHAMAELKRRKK